VEGSNDRGKRCVGYRVLEPLCFVGSNSVVVEEGACVRD
jgi:hypothetical protein